MGLFFPINSKNYLFSSRRKEIKVLFFSKQLFYSLKKLIITMEQKTEEATKEALIKRKDLLKGVMIGLGVVYIIALGILIYIASTKGFKKVFTAFIPLFSLPITLIPLMMNYKALKKRINATKP
jgi:hypothetical protein